MRRGERGDIDWAGVVGLVAVEVVTQDKKRAQRCDDCALDAQYYKAVDSPRPQERPCDRQAPGSLQLCVVLFSEIGDQTPPKKSHSTSPPKRINNSVHVITTPTAARGHCIPGTTSHTPTYPRRTRCGQHGLHCRLLRGHCRSRRRQDCGWGPPYSHHHLLHPARPDLQDEEEGLKG